MNNIKIYKWNKKAKVDVQGFVLRYKEALISASESGDVNFWAFGAEKSFNPINSEVYREVVIKSQNWNLSIYLFLSISIYIYLSISFYLYLSIYLFLYLSIYLSACIFENLQKNFQKHRTSVLVAWKDNCLSKITKTIG